MPDPDVWEDIRRAYETTAITIPKLCKKFGITEYALRKHRTEEGWKVRPAAVVRTKPVVETVAISNVAVADPSASSPPAASCPLPAAQPAAASTPKRPTKRKSISQRRALVQRLTNAIETKLKILESRFEREMAGLANGTSKGISAADFERDARAIGQLIKNLEQVTDYDHGQSRGKSITGAAAKSASLAATALADEADRLRRELGERLQRLVDPAG